VAPEFEAVPCEGAFDKRALDAAFVSERETLFTRGWLRLRELAQAEESLSLLEYPLPEIRARMQQHSA
jgi:hypothetical protein